MNRLYFGDNLEWLSDRKEFPDASVDLIYLDPPFNSNADYNVLFREPSGQVSQAQFHAFTDTWSWTDAADIFHQFIDTCPNIAVVELMEALCSFLKPRQFHLLRRAKRFSQNIGGCFAFHRCDLWIAEASGTLTAGDHDVAFAEFEPNQSCHVALRFGDECLKRLAFRREPEAVVNKLAIFWNESVARLHSQSVATTAAASESSRSCTVHSPHQVQS